MVKLLKYANLLAQVLAALDAVRQTGETGLWTIKGIRYNGGNYTLQMVVTRE